MSNEAISNAAPVEETEPDPLLSVTEIRTDRVCNSIIRRSPSGQFIIELVPWGGAVGLHHCHRHHCHRHGHHHICLACRDVFYRQAFVLHAVMSSTDSRFGPSARPFTFYSVMTARKVIMKTVKFAPIKLSVFRTTAIVFK